MYSLRRIYLAAVAMFTIALAACERLVEVAFALFKPEPLRFVTGSFGFVGSIDGRSLGPALANSLRVEAGQSRRSAPRNT